MFPNFEPTLKVIEELGFVRSDECKYDHIFVKEGIPGRLALFWETASWDISDATWLEFRLGDEPFKKDQWQSLHLIGDDGHSFYMGIQNVPPAEMIKVAIIDQVHRQWKYAKQAMVEAFHQFEKANAEYEATAKVELKW